MTIPFFSDAKIQRELVRKLTMGYRSEVCFSVTKKAKMAMLLGDKSFHPETHRYAKIQHLDDGTTVYHMEHVKWYEEFPDVQQDMGVFDYLDSIDYEEEYSFIRLGEDFNDIEQRGHADMFYPEQIIMHNY